jgi:hypothetical protein
MGYGRKEVKHHSYLTLPLGEVNHQLHTLSVSLLLPTEEIAGWAKELIWKLRRKGKPLATAGKQMVTQLSSMQPSHYSKCANLTPSGYLFYIVEQREVSMYIALLRSQCIFKSINNQIFLPIQISVYYNTATCFGLLFRISGYCINVPLFKTLAIYYNILPSKYQPTFHASK